MNLASFPSVSIIIPVYEDAERLNLCLNALSHQTYPRSNFEIIVIDNSSPSIDLIKAVINQYDVDIFDIETQPGSYAARNRGLDLAQGEIIAFTDADCIPETDWLEQGVLEMIHQSLDMATGGIQVFPKDKNRPNLIERYQMATAFPQIKYMKQHRGGVTANVLVYKDVIEKVGKFDAVLKSGGDLEWGHRIFLAGFKQAYIASAIVHHPARDSWQSLIKKNTRTTGGIYDQKINSKKSWLIRNLIFTWHIMTDIISYKYAFDESFLNPRVSGFKKSFEVFKITLILKHLSAWEKIKIHFGETSKRI